MLTMPAEIAIGELSRETGSKIETIRYYERIGLLPEPRRRPGGYRSYGADDIARLRFIRRARQLGFTLVQVRELLALAQAAGDVARADARRIAAAHLAAVETKIADLRAIERVLGDLIRECEAGRMPRCPLIEALSEENAPY